MLLQVRVNNNIVEALLDTGAVTTLVSREMVTKYNLGDRIRVYEEDQRPELQGVTGDTFVKQYLTNVSI